MLSFFLFLQTQIRIGSPEYNNMFTDKIYEKVWLKTLPKKREYVLDIIYPKHKKGVTNATEGTV